MASTPAFASDRARRGLAALMILEAATLAVVSTVHLLGLTGEGKPPYSPTAAGIAEAIIGVVLVAGAVALVRSPGRGRLAAQVATGFAVVGFLVGLTFTLLGGGPADIAYHFAVLPVLILTFVLLSIRTKPRAGR
ncbi:hypothetical protein [Sinomonas mesophila]|uniref:hypothetical protein n=1 Tax=Sinomonas mesophila TaxID=1531955 RepID=UPI0011159BBC|nr:hypothetical protein [Sinomonas mesophila]